MSGPLIVMTTWRVKEGRLEGFKQFITRLLELVQAREPRMIGFNLFLDEKGPEVTSVQIHPDADSMDNHMQLVGELVVRPTDYEFDPARSLTCRINGDLAYDQAFLSSKLTSVPHRFAVHRGANAGHTIFPAAT